MNNKAAQLRPTPSPTWLRVLRALGLTGMWFILALLTLWAVAALYFDFRVAALRIPVTLIYVLGIIAILLKVKRRRWAAALCVAAFCIVLTWWLNLRPSNDGDWQPDNAKTAYADINGDQVTIHDVRNCDYRTEEDYICYWETRSYDLANLSGTDIFITWWGSPWIAHPIASFDFGDQGHVAMSIETRDVVGQGYSAVRGFFRQYALAYVASDERDVIRLRTNYRKGEEVYLFRTSLTPPMARKIFLEYLQRANSLHARPEWYNALTNNCTTNIAVSAVEAHQTRMRVDWRVLLNGKMDEMMYEHGSLVTGGLPLPALKEQAHINAAAIAADDSSDFSKLIRKGRGGK